MQAGRSGEDKRKTYEESHGCSAEDMQRVGETEGHARNRVKWRQIILCGDL